MKCKISKMLFAALALGLSVSGYSQTAEERAKIVAGFDNYEEVEAFAKQKAEEFEKEYAIALQIAEERGLPLSGTDEQGNFFQLVGIFHETGELKYYKTRNNNPTDGSIQTARAQYLSEGSGLNLNIQGQGMIVGIWDGGQPRDSHESLTGRVISKDGTVSWHFHATHVAGTMVSSGVNPSTKGFAPAANLWANDWAYDISEMTSQAQQGLLVSNHSYGPGYYGANLHNNPSQLGKYNSAARTLDQLHYLRPEYMSVWAAGNDRSGEFIQGAGTFYYNQDKAGADLLLGESVSKNNVVVAAVGGIGEYDESDDVTMSNFSNWGPTDDFRIKPDISAKGVAVTSLGNASDSSIDTQNGTSMAAPAVSGVFILWQQLHNQLWPFRGYMKGATLKALMAATADEAGRYQNGNPSSGAWHSSPVGPNHRFGWGLINAKKGAEVMQLAKEGTTSAIVEELTLQQGEVYEYQFEVPADNDKPLIATISWTDPAGSVNTSSADNPSPALVNDLDLRIFRPGGEEVFPWKLTKDPNWQNLNFVATRGDNDVDTIEKVEYAGVLSGVAAPGIYTIRVSHKGNLSGGSQNFSLVAFSGGGSTSADNFLLDNVRIYPNPVTDLLNIESDHTSLQGASVQVLDVSGRIVKEVRLNNNSGIYQIDMSELVSGVYLVKTQASGHVLTEKIIKR